MLGIDTNFMIDLDSQACDLLLSGTVRGTFPQGILLDSWDLKIDIGSSK